MVIKIVLKKELLHSVDQAARRTRRNRSALVRDAFENTFADWKSAKRKNATARATREGRRRTMNSSRGKRGGLAAGIERRLPGNVRLVSIDISQRRLLALSFLRVSARHFAGEMRRSCSQNRMTRIPLRCNRERVFTSRSMFRLIFSRQNLVFVLGTSPQVWAPVPEAYIRRRTPRVNASGNEKSGHPENIRACRVSTPLCQTSPGPFGEPPLLTCCVFLGSKT